LVGIEVLDTSKSSSKPNTVEYEMAWFSVFKYQSAVSKLVLH
jgi:hypothetical protein